MKPKDTASINENSDINFQDGLDACNKGDYKTAIDKWEALANQGYAKAQSKLGWIYASGTGVPKNDEQAAEWLLKAANQGYAKAQYNLGVMYTKGKGVAKDDKQAVEWFLKAADQDYANAQYNLCKLLR